MSSQHLDLTMLSEHDLMLALQSASVSGDAQQVSDVGAEYARRLQQSSTVQSTLQQLVAQQQQTFAQNLTSMAQQQQNVQSATVQPPGLLGGKVKIEKPPKFDGSPNKLSNFIFRVKQYMSTVGLNDPIEQQKFATSLFEGRALTWWRTECDRAATNYIDLLNQKQFSDLVAELEVAFQDVDRDDKLRRKFQSLRQLSSVQKYIESFRSVLIEMGQARPDDATVLFQFVAGLKDDVQLHVRMANPLLLADAELVAERVDSALFLTKRKDNTKIGKSNPVQRRGGPTPMDIGNVQQQRTPARQQPQQPQQRSKQAVTCYRCGKQGHIARDCRVRLAQNNNVDQQQSKASVSKN